MAARAGIFPVSYRLQLYLFKWQLLFLGTARRQATNDESEDGLSRCYTCGSFIHLLSSHLDTTLSKTSTHDRRTRA